MTIIHLQMLRPQAVTMASRRLPETMLSDMLNLLPAFDQAMMTQRLFLNSWRPTSGVIGRLIIPSQCGRTIKLVRIPSAPVY